MQIINRLRYYFYYFKESYNKKCEWKGDRLLPTLSNMISEKDGCDKLTELIESGKPFSVIRYGYYELYEFFYYSRDLLFGTKKHLNESGIVDAKHFHSAGENDPEGDVGFRRFYDVNVEATKNADMIACWKDMQGIEMFLKMTCAIPKTKPIVNAYVFDSYLYDNSWTKALAGKKVLVISPFSKQIEVQYRNCREVLFADKSFLPEFELSTVQSVWYFAGMKDEKYSTWWEALDYLYEESMKKDFDIALLSCGPFGIPLCERFKKAGRSAIYVGGVLQLYFGIKGARWEGEPYNYDKKFYNEFWVRPEEASKPKGTDRLDNGCYW